MRKTLQRLTALLALGLAVVLGTPAAHAADSVKPEKIGIIGTGRIGSVLARAWVKAGHEVFVSSRHPQELQGLVAELGPHAHAGTPQQAAAFGTIVLVSIPYGAMAQIGTDLRTELAGKIILDTSNPVENRDGAMAVDAQKKGAGLTTAQLLHSTRVVRAFNCIGAASLAGDGVSPAGARGHSDRGGRRWRTGHRATPDPRDRIRSGGHRLTGPNPHL